MQVVLGVEAASLVVDVRRCKGFTERVATADGVAVEDLSRCQAACLPCLVDGLGVVGNLFGDRFNVFFFRLVVGLGRGRRGGCSAADGG